MNIEEILALDDSHRITVKVPEWQGAEFMLVSMSALERADIEKKWAKRDAGSDPAAFRADILMRTLKNNDGSPFGTDEQIRRMMTKNASAIERLFEAACRVSGFSKRDVEELEKN